MLLGVETDNERRNVDDLLADADVALLDEDTGVVDGLGEAELVDAGLETTLKEILSLEGKDVIELHAGLVKDTDAHETANEGIAFEETLGVLLVEGKKLTVAEVSKSCDFMVNRTQSPKTHFWAWLLKNRAGYGGELTGQHDESWRGSGERARPHACCGDHTRQRASTRSP